MHSNIIFIIIVSHNCDNNIVTIVKSNVCSKTGGKTGSNISNKSRKYYFYPKD